MSDQSLKATYVTSNGIRWVPKGNNLTPPAVLLATSAPPRDIETARRDKAAGK